MTRIHTPRSLFALSFLVFTALPNMGCGRSKADASSLSASPAPSAPAKSDPTAALKEIVTKDRAATPLALSELMSEIVVPAHDGAHLEVLNELMLDDPKAWFDKTFPKATAERLLAEYKTIPAEALSNPIKLAVLQRASSGTQAEVYEIEKPNTGDGTGYQSAAIEAMSVKVPLYLVAFRENVPDAATKLAGIVRVWSFVHDGKRFRYVGKLKAVSASPIKEGDATDKTLELTMFEARDGVPGGP